MFEASVCHIMPYNHFWADYADYVTGVRTADDSPVEEKRDEGDSAPFFSKHLAEPTSGFTEMCAALAVLGLVFEPATPDYTYEGAAAIITANCPTIVFAKQLQQTCMAELQPLMVKMVYLNPDQRTRLVDGERVDRTIDDYVFVKGQIYMCRVIITNTSSSSHKVEVLSQIPAGSLPISNGFRTKTQYMTVGSYQSQIHEFRFYFPRTGDYRHYPTTVIKRQRCYGCGGIHSLKVVEPSEKSVVDAESWEGIAAEAEEDAVMVYLQSNNVEEVDLSKIYWRCKGREFWLVLTDFLRRHNKYDSTIWGYSFKHDSCLREMGEYVGQNTNFKNRLKPWFSSGWISYDGVYERKYSHLEYFPLVNSRAHQLGKKKEIQNNKLKSQYKTFLEWVSCRSTSGATLRPEDAIAAVYYLLLQDRVDEALTIYATIDAASARQQFALQYDYLVAYLDFYRDVDDNACEAAMEIVSKYRGGRHPAKKQKLFDDIEAAAAKGDYQHEMEIDAGIHKDHGDAARDQAEAAASEPTFDATINEGARTVVVTYNRLSEVKINFYKMDIELMFSTSPFIDTSGTGLNTFSYIKPNASVTLALKPQTSAAPGQEEAKVPESCRNCNVYVEVLSANDSWAKPFYDNQLDVLMQENFGRLSVRTGGKPVRKAYVKVFCKTKAGSDEFYKDGYTDFRGRFDYASISTDQIDRAAKFSILVLTEKFGAVVKEARMPKQ